MTLGERLKRARKAQNMTQAIVAESIGVDPTTISKWESSVTEPNSETIVQLAKLYKTGVDYLLKDNPIHFFDPKLEHALENASQEQRQRALDYLEGRVDTPVEYDVDEQTIIDSIQTITVDELIQNFNLQINGHPATEDEIREAIMYIKAKRLMRYMKEY